MTTTQDWISWISNIPKESLPALTEAVVQLGLVNKETTSSNAVPVERRKVEDFLLSSCPPYVDIHCLIALYNKVAFQDNLLVKGPKGDGKSLSFVFWAHSTKTPIIKVKCSEDVKDKHLTGSFILRPGETPFILGPLPTAIDIANEYGRAILVFEEINALTPQAQKQLNELLDFQREVSIAQISKTYRLSDNANLWCVATMNPSVYGGTYDLNEDLRSRFSEVEIDYPKHGQEVKIINANVPFSEVTIKDTNKATYDEFVKNCINLANETRKGGMGYSLSSRDVVRAVRGVFQLGLSVEESLQLIACKFENEDRNVIIQRITSTFPKIYLKKSWGG
jgi:hypothetical protein